MTLSLYLMEAPNRRASFFVSPDALRFAATFAAFLFLACTSTLAALAKRPVGVNVGVSERALLTRTAPAGCLAFFGLGCGANTSFQESPALLKAFL